MIGSELIGQNFAADKYFHGRPSATTETDPKDPTKTVPAPYEADNSGGSNLGPTIRRWSTGSRPMPPSSQEENPATPIPVDLVTTSASGLDPDITPAAALFQVPRVAKARHLDPDKLRALVEPANPRPVHRRHRRKAGQRPRIEPRARPAALKVRVRHLAPRHRVRARGDPRAQPGRQQVGEGVAVERRAGTPGSPRAARI